MPTSKNENLVSKYIQIFLIICGYWTVSILTVFVNKRLLSETNLNAPMSVALFQTFITALICFVLIQLSQVFPRYCKFTSGNPFEVGVVKDVVPVSALFTAMIATNNLCLKYVSVAFYYVGRSLTTIFNVIFSYLILSEKTSCRSLLCCFMIIFGFYLGVDQENLAGSLSVNGTIFGVTSSLSLALYSIFIKRVLATINQDIWLLTYYNNIYSTILFIPLMILNGEIVTLWEYGDLLELKFWLLMTVGALCGFTIGIFTSLQIKYTSALTHNISGTAKACVQTILATYWYQETKSFLWWISNGIVLIGSAGYARVKQLEMERKYKSANVYQKV